MFRKHVIRHLSAYCHGELSINERLLVETHLRECRRCRAEYDEIRFGARLASALSLSDAPESTWNDVLKLRHAARRQRWRREAVFAGSAVAVVIAAILAGRPLQPARCDGMPQAWIERGARRQEAVTAPERQSECANVTMRSIASAH